MNKAGFVATLTAASLLGVVLAYWSWAWLAPSAVARTPAAAESAAPAPPYGLFGTAKQVQNASAIRLTGVVAASGARPGQALLRLDGKKTVAVLQGEDVEPGLRLAEVHVDHIVLERNGARETLAWPEKGAK